MGYNGERGSLNQFSDLYRYIESNVKKDLKDLYKESAERNTKINKKELRYFYQAKKIEQSTPLLSFDGGMTTLFPGTVAETCLLKVSAGIPPQFKESLAKEKINDIFFHTFVGKLNFASDPEAIKEALKEEVKRLANLKEFQCLLQTFEITLEDFEDKFLNLVNRWSDKSALKDTIRELLEWALIIDFLQNNSFNNKDFDDDKLPFLIIKDGNISSNPKAVTMSISTKIKELFNGNNKAIKLPLIVGAVKSSRFTGDSILGKVIIQFGKRLPSHSFFRLPPKYEVLLDKNFADQPFDRYFLNLFQGESIYEIQIPNVISKNTNEKIKEKVLDLIASQVTFRYGGTISTNSYAHEQASISAAEGLRLENKISEELDKEIKDEK
jgi:hypothetical protein